MLIGSVISCWINSKLEPPNRWDILPIKPLWKLSRQITWFPSATKRLHKWEPIKPAPPAIKIRFLIERTLFSSNVILIKYIFITIHTTITLPPNISYYPIPLSWDRHNWSFPEHYLRIPLWKNHDSPIAGYSEKMVLATQLTKSGNQDTAAWIVLNWNACTSLTKNTSN